MSLEAVWESVDIALSVNCDGGRDEFGGIGD
jgi:hypothetical protein